MFLANLSLAEFLALAGGVSLLVTLLYLFDRTRRRQVVATLRFWKEAMAVAESRRWRIQQPLSLLLQLASILLLLLAVAQLRIGSSDDGSRDHVLILDTSAWMGARGANGTLMEEARAAALAYVRAVPSRDRVMIVRAGAVAVPATAFESDRAVLAEAIRSSEPGAAALNIRRALDFARRTLALHARRPGEIVFAGSDRVESDGEPLATIPNFRYLPVETTVENVGLRRLGLRHSAVEPGRWDVFVAVHNYGATPRNVDLALEYSGGAAGFRRLRLPAGGDQEVTFPLHTRAAGMLEARLLTADGFPADDRAVLEIPARRRLRVAVYSSQPELLRPLLDAIPLVEASYRAPAEYGGSRADIVVLDRFAPKSPPTGDAIWILPPPEASPVPVTGRAAGAAIVRWLPGHVLSEGLRRRDLKVDTAEVLDPAPGDLSVAEVAQGPVIVARPPQQADAARTVVFGFHPMRSAIRYELTAPLLFANVIRWMRPGIFRQWEFTAGGVGMVTVPLAPDAGSGQIDVRTGSGEEIPFIRSKDSLRFFVGSPGSVRIRAGDRDVAYSAELPSVPESVWTPPAGIRRGVPPPAQEVPASRDLWPWLALLGAAGLLVEWLWFGRLREPAIWGGRMRGILADGKRRMGAAGRRSRFLRRAS